MHVYNKAGFIISILLATSLHAMESAVKYAACAVRTSDMKDVDPAYLIPLPVAQKFGFLKTMLADFQANVIATETVPLPITKTTLAKVVCLTVLCGLHKDLRAQETAITTACQSYTTLELAEISSALNYLDGPQQLLMWVLTSLAQKLHVVKFCAASARICERVDEILPPDLQSLLNEIFLFKFRNICGLITVVQHFKTTKPLHVSGDFMLLDGTLYDLRFASPQRVCSGVKNHNTSKNGRFLVGQIEPNRTLLFDMDTGNQHSIEDAGLRYFINERTLIISSRTYNVKTGLLQDLETFPDELTEALTKNNRRTQDIESICKQLSNTLAVKAFCPSPQHLAILAVNFAIPARPFAALQLYELRLYDISNPQHIACKWAWPNVFAFAYHDSRQLIFGSEKWERDLGAPIDDFKMYKYFTFLDPATFERVSVRLRNDNNFLLERIENYSRADKLLDGIRSLHVRMKNLSTFVEIPLPLQPKNDDILTDYGRAIPISLSEAWFSPSDDECILSKRRKTDGSDVVTTCRLPLKLLTKCSIGQLAMLLNVLKKTPNVDDPYFKQLAQNLPQDLKDLYFCSQPKTHLETRTLENGERMDCAVENDDIPEFLTTDPEIKDQEKSNAGNS